MMTFDEWKEQLAAELGRRFAMDGSEYIRQTGEDCWREMYADGLSPTEAVTEEVSAAQWCM